MTKLKIFISLFLLAGAFIPSTYGYELSTHGAITYNAFQHSVLNDQQTLIDLCL